MHQLIDFLDRNKSDLKTCSCGRVFAPRKPWHAYCSPRCRQAALRTRQTRVTHGMARPTWAENLNAVRSNRSENLQQNQHAFHPQNWPVQAPSHVIEAEVFGGRAWRRIVSSDGVACEVGTLRKRTLVEGGAP